MTVPPLDLLATLAETTTTADPGTAGTALAVTARDLFSQSGQFPILVQNAENDKTNREIMLVTAGQGLGAGSFTVVRGAEGPGVGVAHPVGSYVAQIVTAQSLMRAFARVPEAADQIFLAWSTDPANAFDSSTATLVSGTLQIVRLMLMFPMTITNVVYAVTSVGATLTSAQNFVGIYDSGGTRRALSADQSTIWTSAGLKTTAMTSPWTPAATGPGQFCWVAFLSVGTTPPRFAINSNTAVAGAIAAMNAGLSVSTARFARGPTAQTSLPATITPSALVNSGVSPWVALS